MQGAPHCPCTMLNWQAPTQSLRALLKLERVLWACAQPPAGLLPMHRWQSHAAAEMPSGPQRFGEAPIAGTDTAVQALVPLAVLAPDLTVQRLVVDGLRHPSQVI